MRAGDSWRTDIKRPGFVAADGHPGAPPLATDEAGSGRTSRPPAFRHTAAATLFGNATGDSGDDASARSPNKAATTPKTTTPCRRSAQPSHGAAAPPPHSAPPVACFDNADPGGASGCLLECVAVRTIACVCVHGTSASRRRAEESSHVLTTARRRRRRASRRPRRYEQCTGAAAPSGVSALFGSAFACIPGCVPEVRAPCFFWNEGGGRDWVCGGGGGGERRLSSTPGVTRRSCFACAPGRAALCDPAPPPKAVGGGGDGQTDDDDCFDAASASRSLPHGDGSRSLRSSTSRRLALAPPDGNRSSRRRSSHRRSSSRNRARQSGGGDVDGGDGASGHGASSNGSVIDTKNENGLEVGRCDRLAR